MKGGTCAIIKQINKSEFVEDRYENTVFDWRYNGYWQNNNQPTVEKRLAQQCFLDGDWCWDADPFQVTEETKEMVMRNLQMWVDAEDSLTL